VKTPYLVVDFNRVCVTSLKFQPIAKLLRGRIFGWFWC